MTHPVLPPSTFTLRIVKGLRYMVNNSLSLFPIIPFFQLWPMTARTHSRLLLLLLLLLLSSFAFRQGPPPSKPPPWLLHTPVGGQHSTAQHSTTHPRNLEPWYFQTPLEKWCLRRQCRLIRWSRLRETGAFDWSAFPIIGNTLSRMPPYHTTRSTTHIE